MAKKLNQNLLNEELKKFRLLSEYTFYTEKDNMGDQDKDLILGSGLDEADETEDPNAAPEADAEDQNLFDTGDEPNGDQPADAETGIDPMDEPAQDPASEPVPPAPAPADNGDVEVDVTELVKGNEEATSAAQEATGAAQDASHKTSELLSKFEDLEQKVSSMDALSHKIETLEKEIIKRNPTPVEKLEMRSLDSYPFNIKISDYWKDVDGYEAKSEEPKEYILTKDDIDNSFTDATIKKSLNVPEDYEEEDIY